MKTIKTKQDAIQVFGGTQRAICRALGLSPSTVCNWPDTLPQTTADRLTGAAVRLGLM